ncbi:hypothetical protein DFH06DRAFT_1465163 [Mycena polygramma]|nr:hypothetical protein DFH06DRAFT_1465163 [Mycena polygramma]
MFPPTSRLHPAVSRSPSSLVAVPGPPSTPAAKPPLAVLVRRRSSHSLRAITRLPPSGRGPTVEVRIQRVQLKAHGTWQELYCDGHEKLGSLALQMGGVGLPIYGMKDKWGGEILYLVVIPDDRHSDVIGHVFLDFIELYGAIPQQVTVDKGSETGHLYAMMTGLKTGYAPKIDLTRYPAFVAVKSTNNTPIEGLWRWFQNQIGKNLYLYITKGRDEGIFNPDSTLSAPLSKQSATSSRLIHE